MYCTGLLHTIACMHDAGARRGILNIPGVEEDVGLIGIHWQGKFIELVPWNAEVSWEIAPWGQWKVRCTAVSYACCHHMICICVPPASMQLCACCTLRGSAGRGKHCTNTLSLVSRPMQCLTYQNCMWGISKQDTVPGQPCPIRKTCCLSGWGDGQQEQSAGCWPADSVWCPGLGKGHRL